MQELSEEAKIKSIISKIIKVPFERLDLDEDLVEKHGMDSLARVEVVVAMEKLFDVTIDDSLASHLRSVRHCIDLLRKVRSS